MSRAGKPTDNPVNEALNGWIKEELKMEYHIGRMMRKSELEEALAKYVKFYNEKHPCYAIDYDTPENYRKRYYKGELQVKKTSENENDRKMMKMSTFVKSDEANLSPMSTLENINF